jgi:hypothetical protein
MADIFSAADRDPYYAPSGPGGLVAGAGAGAGAPSPFQMFSDQPAGSAMASATLARVWDSSQMGDATAMFLSPTNVSALQDAIRYRVYVESDGQHTIGRQSETELALVMRSILLQHGRNDNTADMYSEVRALNTEVISWCVPRILSEVRQYVRYREDVSTLPVPMERGGLATTKGDKALPMKPLF